MGRPKSSGRVDLSRIFHQMQAEMLAHLAAGDFIDQPTSCGAITEAQWLELFHRYLPQRYCASSAFIVDADGRRSRQIDIAVYDRFYSPLLFPHHSGLHIPAEAVYAVFEVKHELTSKWISDAGCKAASVRRLRRTSIPFLSAGASRPPIAPHPILAGVLAPRAIWTNYQSRLASALRRLPPDESLDLGCVLRAGAFETLPKAGLRFSTPSESLVFFVLRLLDRLRAIGTAPAADLMAYGRSLDSFRPSPSGGRR